MTDAEKIAFCDRMLGIVGDPAAAAPPPMTPAEATALVVAMRNRCPVRPGSVPYQLTADHRQALTLLLAAAATEAAEPRQLGGPALTDLLVETHPNLPDEP